jgi:hypothetical protein
MAEDVPNPEPISSVPLVCPISHNLTKLAVDSQESLETESKIPSLQINSGGQRLVRIPIEELIQGNMENL